MERVVYHFEATEENPDGKYEAILDVVHAEGNQSEVLVSAGPRVEIVYLDGERSRLEPIVQAIMQNTDGTFWDISEKAVHGISQTEIRYRLNALGLEVGQIRLTSTSECATVTAPVSATPHQWQILLARLEAGERHAAFVGALDNCDADD